MRKHRERLKPGCVVGISLPSGGFALAHLTHVGKHRKPIVIGRFFAKKFVDLPDAATAMEFVLSNEPDIIGKAVAGDLKLEEWSLIATTSVAEGGVPFPVLLQWTNVGWPAVSVIDPATCAGYDSREPLPGELDGEIGSAGLMGTGFVALKLEKYINEKEAEGPNAPPRKLSIDGADEGIRMISARRRAFSVPPKETSE